MGGHARNLDGQLLMGNGVSDHVHLAAVIPAKLAVSEFVGKLKSNASGWIHDTFSDLGEFSWQNGYAAFSISPSILPKVKQYIRNQQEHHRKMTFQEELIALLEKHGVEYDKRYIFA
jgi:REP element-mobilizing transposase RayT